MPVRFQVDPDFYDHPKALGMSDAAFALWVRAGSYCAAKTTDGFVADDVLSLFSETQRAAAPELVRRRLWRRAKGGYTFHQYAERNLTKSRIQADRDYDRDRKRRERQANRPGKRSDKHPSGEPVDNSQDPDTRNPQPQVAGQIVRTGHQPDSEPESGWNPNRSVSVSVSESVSGSGHGTPPRHTRAPTPQEPPRQCLRHLDDPDPPPCRRCADQRHTHDTWLRAQRDHDQRGGSAVINRDQPQCHAHRGQPAHNCAMCRAEALAGDHQ